MQRFIGDVSDLLQFPAYRAPITYNLQVAKEVLKHIYVAERLQVPSVAEFKSAYSLFAQRATNPAYLRSLFSSGEWATVGIYGLEAYGIYKVRRSRSIERIHEAHHARTDWRDYWQTVAGRLQRSVDLLSMPAVDLPYSQSIYPCTILPAFYSTACCVHGMRRRRQWA